MQGDLSARVGNEEVVGVMVKYGVPGRNVSGERLLELCSELELMIGNMYFRKKGINKFTWERIDNGRLVEREVIVYMSVERGSLGRLVDMHVLRGLKERCLTTYC